MSGLPERGIYFQERGPAPFCAANRQKIWPDSRAGQAGSLWSSLLQTLLLVKLIAIAKSEFVQCGAVPPENTLMTQVLSF